MNARQETIETYYHVAPASYRGGDLLSRDELENRGILYMHKWETEEEDYPDGDIVSLHTTLEDAKDYLAEFEPNGQILKVDIPEWAYHEGLRVLENNEGYPCVLGKIPGEFVIEVEVTQ